MTFDEFKEYTKAALDLAGDATPDTRAAIVIAVINGSRVQMPSDLAQMQQFQQAQRGDLAITGMSAGRGPGPLPRIG